MKAHLDIIISKLSPRPTSAPAFLLSNAMGKSSLRKPSQMQRLAQIPYLDLNTQTPPLRYIDALRTAYTLSGDGIHPNADGYRLFYVPKITAFMKGL